MSAINPTSQPETYREYKDKLNEGNELFVCNKCEHKVGDPRLNNFRARCPACRRQVKFYRIIE